MHCKDGQLTWLEGHFEKVVFSRLIDILFGRTEFIVPGVQDNEHQGTKKTEVIETGAPAEG